METYQNLKTYCPKCEHILFRGPLMFGPSIVECKKCQQTISTGLTEWQDLSFSQKFGNILKELFLPSFFIPNRDSFTRGFLHFFFFCFTFILATPLFILFEENLQGSFIANILVVIASFWYAIFILLARILRIRKQSIKYVNENIIPKWEKVYWYLRYRAII